MRSPGGDGFAEFAATEHQTDDADVQAIASADNRTCVVQKRILAAYEFGLDPARRPPVRPSKRPARITMSDSSLTSPRLAIA